MFPAPLVESEQEDIMREEPEEQVENITLAQNISDAALEEEYHKICHTEKSLQRELPDATNEPLPHFPGNLSESTHRE